MTSGASVQPTKDVNKISGTYTTCRHPDKAGNVSEQEREERTNKMKEINSAYVCLTQGEDEQEEDFPDGFPWSMPDEVLASLYAAICLGVLFLCHCGSKATVQAEYVEAFNQ